MINKRPISESTTNIGRDLYVVLRMSQRVALCEALVSVQRLMLMLWKKCLIDCGGGVFHIGNRRILPFLIFSRSTVLNQPMMQNLNIKELKVLLGSQKHTRTYAYLINQRCHCSFQRCFQNPLQDVCTCWVWATVSPGHCHHHTVEATSNVHYVNTPSSQTLTSTQLGFLLKYSYGFDGSGEDPRVCISNKSQTRLADAVGPTDHTSRGKDPHWFPRQTHICSLSTLRPEWSSPWELRLGPSLLCFPFYLPHHMKGFNDYAVVQIRLGDT